MKLVILDRDGTLNQESEDFVKSPEEWVPLRGVAEAVAQLNHAGWRVAVACNQPGLGRGLFDMAVLNTIHAKMHKHMAAVGARIDAVFFCPHGPEDHCACRKPKAGLFEQLIERYGVSPADVQVVGNNAEHLQPAAAVGARPHLVLTGTAAAWAGGAALPGDFPEGTRVHADLAAFARALTS